MASNQISVAVGIAMIVAGVGLWGIAAFAQHQRNSTPLAAVASECSPCPTCSACPACSLPSTHEIPAVNSAPAVSHLAAVPEAPAPPSASNPAPSNAPNEGEPFLFEPRKTSLQKDEIPRIITYCRGLLKQPQVKIQIEGIAEEDDPKGLILGRNRALITRMLLVDAGLDGDRLVLIPPRVQATGASGVKIYLLENKAP